MNTVTSGQWPTAARSGHHRARHTSSVIIGAGHNGLAVSHCLSQQGVDHVILERGTIANSWRSERWDSLRLLTPNWQCQLPGQAYQGTQPHGYMPIGELIAFIDDYAASSSAPIHTQCAVQRVQPTPEGYCISTNQGQWHCRSVVIASGACNTPIVPACSGDLAPAITQLSAHSYRNPAQLAPGGVLVVGASATGIQLAHEIHRSGHPVTLCVGEHVRLPRGYRGRDIMWWMDRLGLLDEDYRSVDDLTRARNVASAQLIGSPERHTLDLNALSTAGIELVGKLAGITDSGQLQFSAALANVCQLADLKLRRLLNNIDSWIDEQCPDQALTSAEPPAPTRLPQSPRLQLEPLKAGIRNVIWACGFRPDYRWLQVPVLDHKGRIRHDGGVTSAPGLYVVGLPFLRRRKSGLIYGASDDARFISEHLSTYLRQTPLRTVAKRTGSG